MTLTFNFDLILTKHNLVSNFEPKEILQDNKSWGGGY